MPRRLVIALVVASGAVAAAGPPAAANGVGAGAGLKPCRLTGVEHEALCGSVRRPLDPAAPGQREIEIHFAVLPALARHKLPDPVFALAGGPGQSAIDLAGSYGRLLARLSNRRDVVLVDQRGTGRSAPLACPTLAPTTPLAEVVGAGLQEQRLARCRAALQQLPHGDLRHFTTWVAMQDLDAVRAALGAERINLVGSSYGTRAALEYQRQFGSRVRRLVLDGVAPPDTALPAAFSGDSQAALEGVFAACEASPRCRARHPALRERWRQLLGSLPREVTLAHPFTGEVERLVLTRETMLAMVRPPLYAPALAAALPAALEAAARGRFEALAALSASLQGRVGPLAEGMHFSVLCAEDLAPGAATAERPGADFGETFAALYQRVCADWPRGEVPAAFRSLGTGAAPALVLSGGADPATPPRHGERVARALGPRARHVVVAQAGHGVLGLPCMRDVLFRFIDAADDAAAAAVPTDCALALPRPPVFVAPGPAALQPAGRP